MYAEFLKAQSNSVRVDGSLAKHEPPPTPIYDWYYPIKIPKDAGSCVASCSSAEFGLNHCFVFRPPLGLVLKQELKEIQSDLGSRVGKCCRKLLEETPPRSLSALILRDLMHDGPGSLDEGGGNLEQGLGALSNPPPRPKPLTG